MTLYSPSLETENLLNAAYQHVQSVPYNVTARWVFYRLLQSAIFSQKSDYKKLLGHLSKARKAFHGGWTPWTLADDTRGAAVNGGGFESGEDWLRGVKNMECSLDKWPSQDRYVEVWFEASAMESQFRHHTNENISLLAFHGDVSIPEKWRSADRIARRWLELQVPVSILYYGDLDDKGLQIPISAEKDVFQFILQAIKNQLRLDAGNDLDKLRTYRDRAYAEYLVFSASWEFTRVGLNHDQVFQYNVPENPERPGTYQWEGLDDDAAQELIEVANGYISLDGFEGVEEAQRKITSRFRDHLDNIGDLDGDEDKKNDLEHS